MDLGTWVWRRSHNSGHLVLLRLPHSGLLELARFFNHTFWLHHPLEFSSSTLRFPSIHSAITTSLCANTSINPPIALSLHRVAALLAPRCTRILVSNSLAASDIRKIVPYPTALYSRSGRDLRCSFVSFYSCWT